MAEPLISIIIPVYNVEPYLHKCLDSVLKQTYTNLEVMLIDDGSTDGSAGICHAYAAADKRIRLVRQENQGPGMARNKGLDLCQGEYIFFIDADDYMDLDLLQTLYVNLCLYDADMVACYTKNVVVLKEITDDGNDKAKFSKRVVYENQEELYVDLYLQKVPVCIWGKLFKRQFFLTHRFEKYRMSEDVLLWLSLYGQIKKAVFLQVRKYYYVVRADSLMSYNKFNTNIFDDQIIMGKLREALPKISKKLGQVGERRYFYSIFIMLCDMYRYGLTERYMEKMQQCQQEVRQSVFSILSNPFIEGRKKIGLFLIALNLNLFLGVKDVKLKAKSVIDKIKS